VLRNLQNLSSLIAGKQQCVTVRLTVVVTSYVEVAHETNNLDGPLMIEWVDFTSQEYFRNPTSEIERLRALGPVVKPT